MSTTRATNVTVSDDQHNITDHCSRVLDLHGHITLSGLPLPVLLYIGLSFYQRRKSSRFGCGRPALLYPIDMLHDPGRLWSIGCVLVIMSSNVLNLFMDVLVYKPAIFSDSEFQMKYGWTSVFLVMLNVLIVAIVYVPFLTCIALRRNLLPNIIGLLYTIPMIMTDVYRPAVCFFLAVDVSLLVHVYGFLSMLPRMLAIVAVAVSFTLDLIICLRRTRGSWVPAEQVEDALLHTNDAISYVKALLKRPRRNRDAEVTVWEKVKAKVQYRVVTGFHYSPRFVCTMVMSLVTLSTAHYILTHWIDMTYDVISSVIRAKQNLSSSSAENQLDFFAAVADELESIGLMAFNTSERVERALQVLRGIEYWSYIIYVITMLSDFVSTAVHIGIIIDIILKYRTNMRRLIGGDYSFQANIIEKINPTSAAMQCLTYSGYQVAYLLHGWFIHFILQCTTLLIATVVIFEPLSRGQVNLIIEIIIKLGPSVAVIVFLGAFQKLMCRFLFIQGDGKQLALTNIRVYNLINFFFFFNNVMQGFLSCIQRIFYSLVFGTLLISRLDRPILMRGFESYDGGYMSYLGMLKLELHHCHPILKAFVEILGEQRRNQPEGTSLETEYGESADSEAIRRARCKRLFRSIMFKSITLINNPILLVERVAKDARRSSDKCQTTVDIHAITERTRLISELYSREESRQLVSGGTEACI